MLPSFRLARPRTLDEALEAIGDDRVPYCGGTELLLAMRAGLTRPELLVDLKQLRELAGISVDDGHVVIGGTERHMDVAASSIVQRYVPMLSFVEQRVGNARVRAQGSIAGNLCFAEPKSDVGPALMAFGASVVLAAPHARREITVQDLIQGPYFADKEADELLVEVRIPIPSAATRAAYLKYQITERPTVGVAVAHDPEAGTCRLVVGAVGEVPTVWTGTSPDEIDAEAIAAEVDPTPDLTGSGMYKRHVTGVYVRRVLAKLADAKAGA